MSGVKVSKYEDTPAFQINVDIESVFKKNYERTLKDIVVDVAKEAMGSDAEKNLRDYKNEL